MCRRIDRVTVKGSETPMDLYTWDVCNFPDHRALVPKVRRRAVTSSLSQTCALAARPSRLVAQQCADSHLSALLVCSLSLTIRAAKRL